MQPLATTIGKESFANASSKVFSYHEPHGPLQAHLKEQSLNQIAKEAGCSHICRKLGPPIITPSVNGVRADIGGDWTQQSYELAEGEIVKICVSRKRVWNKLPETAHALIQIRANAPLHKFSAKLVGGQNARFKLADYTGRFDIITLEDALNKGVSIAPQYRHLFAASLVAQCFEVAVLEPEIAPPVAVNSTAVQTASGAVRVVQVRTRRRALEM